MRGLLLLAASLQTGLCCVVLQGLSTARGAPLRHRAGPSRFLGAPDSNGCHCFSFIKKQRLQLLQPPPRLPQAQPPTTHVSVQQRSACCSGGPAAAGPLGIFAAATAATAAAAAAPVAAAAATSLCGYALPAAFKGARRWLSLARCLRGSPTPEDRLKMLMQLSVEADAALGAPSNLGAPGELGLPAASSPTGDRGSDAAGRFVGSAAEVAAVAPRGSAANATAASAAAAAAIGEGSGSLLVGPWQRISRCASAAFLRVSLSLPAALSNADCSSTSKLCCAATARGVTVSIQSGSDSLVVGGLLQLLVRSLSGGAPCDVGALRALGSRVLLRRSGLLRILPDTRAEGFQEALEALAATTRDLLLQLGTPREAPSLQAQRAAADAWSTQANPSQSTSAWPLPPPLAAAAAAAPAAAVAESVAIAAAEEEESTGALAGISLGEGGELHSKGGPPILCEVGPPGSLLVSDTETAAWAAASRSSLPAVGDAGAEVHVLLSGGVDSSVTLMLLREWGLRPKPVFLKVWAAEVAQLHQQQQRQQDRLLAAAAAAAAACPWQKDLEAAKAAAAAAGLPLEIVSVQQEYWERVISVFLEGAQQGLTLNPDWRCNALVKFGAFAEAVGTSQGRIASGHYARIEAPGGPQAGAPRLLRGVDTVKDQSYFLSGLSPAQLSRLLLPVGPLTKAQVRQLALRWRLPSAQRPDSQGLCFLGPLPVAPFLMHLLGTKGGPVLHFPSGAPVGRHEGLWSFTAGQQRGVVPLLDPRLCRRCRGVTGGPPTLSGPWSVLGKLPEANALFVVSREEEAAAEEAVKALAAAANNAQTRERLGQDLLRAAARGEQGTLLALKLRQLRTHLMVENIRWISGVPPRELTVSHAGQQAVYGLDPERAFRETAAAAAAATAAVQGGAILSGMPSGEKPGRTRVVGRQRPSLPGAEKELVVQVRHGAAFVGVSKHKFKPLWISGENPRDPGTTQAAELLLEEPDVGLAPGQVAAFYRGDECLGAGQISVLQGASLLREAMQKGIYWSSRLSAALLQQVYSSSSLNTMWQAQRRRRVPYGRLADFVGKRVRLVGRIKEAEEDAVVLGVSGGKSVRCFMQGAPPSCRYVEVVATVQDDLTVKQGAGDQTLPLGDNIAYEHVGSCIACRVRMLLAFQSRVLAKVFFKQGGVSASAARGFADLELADAATAATFHPHFSHLFDAE
ncbi:hypothetical protein Esti_003084 [Eimeria stiedai]